MGHRSNAIGERAVVAWRAPPRVRDEGYACASRGALTRPRDGERRKYPSARTSVARRLASGDGRSAATHARAGGCATGRRFLEGGPARCGMRAIRAATHGPLADHVPSCAGDHARGGLPSAAAAVRADTSGGRRAECVELWSGTSSAPPPLCGIARGGPALSTLCVECGRALQLPLSGSRAGGGFHASHDPSVGLNITTATAQTGDASGTQGPWQRMRQCPAPPSSTRGWRQRSMC